MRPFDVGAAIRAGEKAAVKLMVRFVIAFLIVVVVPTYAVIHFVAYDWGLFTMLVAMILFGMGIFHTPTNDLLLGIRRRNDA